MTGTSPCRANISTARRTDCPTTSGTVPESRTGNAVFFVANNLFLTSIVVMLLVSAFYFLIMTVSIGVLGPDLAATFLRSLDEAEMERFARAIAGLGRIDQAMMDQVIGEFLDLLTSGPEVSGETPFTDLTANWYKDAVLWAYQTGVTSGTSETTFSPDDPVTREQVVVRHDLAGAI